MFSRLFIQNPVFTAVIALITLLLGVLTATRLPIELYPNSTPPTVMVAAHYPGADAKTIADSVGAPLEQSINGIQGMDYMSSKSSDSGAYTLTVTFAIGIDPNLATVQLQNLVNNALPKLPAAVQQQGITVTQSSPAILQVIALRSPNKTYDSLYLANYAAQHLQNVLARIEGVGQVELMGASNYAIRVWLNLDKMNALKISIDEVNTAIQQQNVNVPAGQVGSLPAAPGQTFQLTVLTQGLFDTPEAFGEIIVKTAPRDSVLSGQIVRLRDIATIDLGAESYSLISRVHSADAALLAIYQLPGANALSTVERITAAMHKLERDFPTDVIWSVPFNTTTFVSTAVTQVYETFFKATLLVVCVVLLFLQNWRAGIGPAIVIPVTIAGAFIAMGALGFSINIITLFALVLAIGLIVDDSIIVVESTTLHLEKGAAPQTAALLGMQDLFLPILAVSFVFASVFVPAAFLGGITGQLFRQFALVIGCTAILSALFALTLNPTVCARWLRPSTHQVLPLPLRMFNRGYDALYHWTITLATQLLHTPLLAFPLYLIITIFAFWGCWSLPKGFLPSEDQGYVMVNAQLPDAAALPRTERYMDQLEQAIRTIPGVAEWVVVGGTSLLTGNTTPNAVTAFVIFKDWSLRPTISEADIVRGLETNFSKIPEGLALVIPPPPIMGIGNAAGFDLMIEDRGSKGPLVLEKVVRQLETASAASPDVQKVVSLYSADTPQLFLHIDRTHALTNNLTLPSVFSALHTALGGSYINNITLNDRNYQVRVQAQARYRSTPDDVSRLRVLNTQGTPVPLSTFSSLQPTTGTSLITRYNLYPSASLQGSPGPDRSSAQAMLGMEALAEQLLPPGFGFEWTGMAYQEQKAAGQTGKIIGLALVLVYLILAALYADWLLPLAVLCMLPLAVSGTVAAVMLRGMAMTIYVQIGLLLLIAMASKNALILIQFARRYAASGQSFSEAALNAARIRFRPILMSSLAFAAGALPLLWATGAGAASQRSLGTTIFGGMVATAVMSALYTPVFFVFFMKLSERFQRGKPKGIGAAAPAPLGGNDSPRTPSTKG